VLIDSRTGLTDAGGVCTILLPDIVVAMFTANFQSLYGVRDVMRLAQHARQNLAYDRMPLTILPIPSRFGTRAEFKVSQEWLNLFEEALKEFYEDWLPKDIRPRQVLQQTKIPQVDYFGFGEKLAVVEHGVGDPEGMGYVYNKVANLLANDFKDVKSVIRIDSDIDDNYRLLSRMNSKRDDYVYDLFVSYPKGRLSFDMIRELIENLRIEMVQLVDNFQIFLDASELLMGDALDKPTQEALKRSKLLLALTTPVYFSRVNSLLEWKTFDQRSQITGVNLTIPVALRGAQMIPSWFQDYQYIDFSEFSLVTIKSGEYRKNMKIVADQIYGLLRNVPHFNVEWPLASVEDIKDIIETKSMPKGRAKFPYK